MQQPPPIAFNRAYDAVPDQPWRCSPLIRCVLTDNPGPYTFTGTNTYLIGQQQVAVVDPGPDIDAHLEAILAAVGEGTVTHVLVTHTHADHSPLSRKLVERTGATTFAYGPHPSPAEDGKPEEESDRDFVPDVVMRHGDIVGTDEWEVRALFTPGHIANHLCFALESERTVFTGDHIMGWSTSVISPRDGDLADFYDSCAMLIARDDDRYLSAHGAPIDDPRGLVEAIVGHRRFRDSQIVELLADVHDIDGLVAAIYAGLDERLVKAAAATVYSHLVRMERLGLVAHEGTSFALVRS